MIDGLTVGKCLRQVQNLVFHASLNGDKCILRLSDPAHRSLAEIREELKLLGSLQADGRLSVAKPLLFPSGKSLEECFHNGKSYNGVLFSYIDGVEANIYSPQHSFELGMTLAKLHTALSEQITRYDFPVMNDAVGDQLIHGDFNSSNILVNGNIFSVIDFEDACYSSYEFELANTIYMALFDSRNNVKMFDDSGFIRHFLEGYTEANTVDLEKLRPFIDLRVKKLKSWISDPEIAPIAISSSTESWKQELTKFVFAYEKGTFNRSLKAASSPQ